MFNRKSSYALNKKDPNAIVYMDANEAIIRLTREDFASEEEFLKWKVKESLPCAKDQHTNQTTNPPWQDRNNDLCRLKYDKDQYAPKPKLLNKCLQAFLRGEYPLGPSVNAKQDGEQQPRQ